MATRNSNGAGDKQQQKNATEELFKAFHPNNMLNNAQRILTTAANVLEEEIAAGILAAKKIEKKVIDTDNLNTDPEELMSRIRRDTHEAVDLFLDALTAITQQLGILSSNLKKETTAAAPIVTPPPSSSSPEPTVPVATADHAVKAGSTAVLHIALTNESNTTPTTITLIKTDMTGMQLQKISAKHISLEPMVLQLNPAEQKEIVITIKVPKTALPGHYCALLMDIKNPAICTVIALDII